jgi:hypothetical protein
LTRRQGSRSTSVVDRGCLRLERRRDDWAALSRPVEVLQRHDRRVNASELGCCGAIFREGDGDGWVIDDVARCDIPIQNLNMLVY